MIKLITGKKGSGKTKKLIDLVNSALEQSKGNVVVIDQGKKLTYDIKYTARLIDADEYSINSYDSFYGFIAGLTAGNYDITDIYIDGILRIGGRDYNELADTLARLDVITKDKVAVTFTISADDCDLPEGVTKYIK